MVGLENFELAGIKSYTRFWGLLMFGSYSVINVIVLLNLLIAMMSNSYAMIDEHSDVEWKFARTRLWMSYFEGSATLPPPFNIFPTPKLLLKMLGLRKKDQQAKEKLKEKVENELDVRYTAVMRALVWRYVSAMHRKMDDEPVTEDDVNELKGDVSALRYELLEVFEKNGMDVSFTDRKEKTVLGKRMKVWERRLMKDFHVAPVALEEEEEKQPEDGLSRFRRLAKLAVASTSTSKWDQTLIQTGISTQIGRCRSRASFKNQQNLQRAMDEAKKLVMRSPIAEGSRGASPISMPATPGHTLLELIKDISEEVGPTPEGGSTPLNKSPWKPPSTGTLLGAAMKSPCRGSSPRPRTTTPVPCNMGIVVTPRQSPAATPVPSPASTPRGPSPVSSTSAKSVSPEVQSEERQTEPSPLIGKRVPGDTPPKVIKRKPPVAPVQDDQAPAEDKPTEDIAVARPVAPEIKPTEGAIPPPPAPVKPKAPPAPTMEVTPSTPPKSPAPSAKPPSPPKSPTPPAKPPSPPKSPAPSVRAPSPQTSAPPRSHTPPAPAPRLSSTSSTEQLIPPPSPAPLRPQVKIDEVKTIKRQPKYGWL